ncbi:hypothetical protein C9374_010226 [Naegleria lovaniensis]|uniref:Uncharacterized protein n=1 Tax=Naegleria lovaniensis TaxID=51637 RepID=A0AA88GC15_NAELO|nr:uncharacterized protein C9374_010226 [Naegleria lovaniensis]KAG2374852.1 hypothetical protein C9374_010226 [Naegleria lovaniensis]
MSEKQTGSSSSTAHPQTIACTQSGNMCTEEEEEKRLQHYFQKFYKTDKRHRIDLQWFGHPISNDMNRPVLVDILVSSRKLKNEETSPTEVLFKTHSYEIKLIPNEHFFEWNGGRKSGYTVELKLFKKVVNTRKKKDEDSQDSFAEHTDCGVPLISYTFTEDVFSNTWILNLIWPDEKTKISFRGDFFFSVSVFRKVDADTSRRIFTRVSSRFKIVSKPGVYLNKKRKKNVDEEEDVEGDSELFKKLPPPSHFIPTNPSTTLFANNSMVNLLPNMDISHNSSLVNQYYQQVVFEHVAQSNQHPIISFFPPPPASASNSAALPFPPKSSTQTNQFFGEQQQNVMQPPKFSLEKTQDLFSFTQASQLAASQHTSTLLPSLSDLGNLTTPMKTEQEENPFSPITPSTPITPLGIFGTHQPTPQKGVLSLNFSQEVPTSNTQDPWSFFNSQEEIMQDSKKDDFYYKMLADEKRV